MGFLGSDTVALVTGGSRGLGLAAARGIGGRGARVIVLGRDDSRVTAAAAELVDDGVEAIPWRRTSQIPHSSLGLQTRSLISDHRMFWCFPPE